MLDYARDLRRPHRLVDQFAFVLFVLRFRVSLALWVGTYRVDIIDLYAPWAAAEVAHASPVEVLAVQMSRAEATGAVLLRPRSTGTT